MSVRLLRPEEKLAFENIVIPVANTKRICFSVSLKILYRLRNLFLFALAFSLCSGTFIAQAGHIHRPVPPSGQSFDEVDTGYVEAARKRTSLEAISDQMPVQFRTVGLMRYLPGPQACQLLHRNSGELQDT